MTTDATTPPPSPATGPTPDERTWGTIAHASALIGILLGGLAVLGPLVVWLVKKNESAWVETHAREALNFQITMLIVFAVLVVLGFATCGIGFVILPVAGVVDIVLTIMAAMKANAGEAYKYPFALRLV